ncbi:hypothetical protein AKJ44_02965 [candidate division MSBL1 archaeon SCGC-AAA261F17]|uniref:Uncharacterized protein n=1 Tax=candidate division MSBL1 archaeon SCGC-AAA261F17 TaxID=1698274 RepID=A0A133V3S1_9EURY|nr:hypothetical protein AKJ44_02965 [candidate division MSBL1 archaeon SCGC-AAA261F17]
MDFEELKKKREEVHEDIFYEHFSNYYGDKNILTKEEFDFWWEIEDPTTKERASKTVEIEGVTYNIYAIRVVQDGYIIDDMNTQILVVRKSGEE